MLVQGFDRQPPGAEADFTRLTMTDYMDGCELRSPLQRSCYL